MRKLTSSMKLIKYNYEINEIVLCKYLDGFYYKAKIIRKYNNSYYIKWDDGSKDDRIKYFKNIKKIPSNNDNNAGVEYILLASLLLEGT